MIIYKLTVTTVPGRGERVHHSRTPAPTESTADSLRREGPYEPARSTGTQDAGVPGWPRCVPPGHRRDRQQARQPGQPAKSGRRPDRHGHRPRRSALDRVLRTGQPVTFRRLAAAAPVSLDFLYCSPGASSSCAPSRLAPPPPTAALPAPGQTSPATSWPR